MFLEPTIRWCFSEPVFRYGGGSQGAAQTPMQHKQKGFLNTFNSFFGKELLSIQISHYRQIA